MEDGSKVDIIFWLNGKGKEYSFKFSLIKNRQLSISSLKAEIIQHICNIEEYNRVINKYNHLYIYHLYNKKEIELEDEDIPYLNDNDIIFFTLDNSPFKNSNHYHQYEFINLIKTGGFGNVFLASHVITKKIYAIKQIDVSSFSAEELYNISREHLILLSMTHKNVIKSYESFTYKNNYYTVMDYAEGGELTDLLDEQEYLSEELAKKLFKQIYDAVCYIHNNNIIHRDLKPNNILFLDKERTHLVVIDFGISGFSNGNQKESTKAGTLRFLPPEMVKNENFESNRNLDMWSLGVILYRMVQGVYPFNGKNAKEMIKHIIQGNITFNKKIKISSECKTLIEGLLNPNPSRRIDNNSPLFNDWFESTERKIPKEVNNRKDNDKDIKRSNNLKTINHCKLVVKSYNKKRNASNINLSSYKKRNSINSFSSIKIKRTKLFIRPSNNNSINKDNFHNSSIKPSRLNSRKNDSLLPKIAKKRNNVYRVGLDKMLILEKKSNFNNNSIFLPFRDSNKKIKLQSTNNIVFKM